MERKRLNGNEQKDFINLCAAESLCNVGAIIKRVDSKQLESIRESIQSVVGSIMETMPIEQLSSYHKQMRHIAISVGVKRADNYDDWDGRYLKFSEINALLEGCGDHCLMCDKEPATMKRCGIRKVYNTLPAESVCSGLSCEE